MRKLALSLAVLVGLGGVAFAQGEPKKEEPPAGPSEPKHEPAKPPEHPKGQHKHHPGKHHRKHHHKKHGGEPKPG